MARGLRPVCGLLSWHASAATGGGLSFSGIRGTESFIFWWALGNTRDRWPLPRCVHQSTSSMSISHVLDESASITFCHHYYAHGKKLSDWIYQCTKKDQAAGARGETPGPSFPRSETSQPR